MQKNFYFYLLPIVLTVILFFVAFSLSTVNASTVEILHQYEDDAEISDHQTTILSGGYLTLDTSATILNDDFTSYSEGTFPSTWEQYSDDASASWSVSASNLVYGNNDYDQGRAFWSGGTFADGQLSANMKILGGEEMAGITYRMQDGSNYYLVLFSSRYDFISLNKIVGNSLTQIKSYDTNFDLDTDYDVKVIFSGLNYSIYVDDVLMLEGTDGTYTQAGKVGVYRNGTGVQVHNISASNSQTQRGLATSAELDQGQNIASVNLSSIQGSNLTDQYQVYVSNDAGESWRRIVDGQSIIFESTGQLFQYKIYLENINSLPSIDSLSFTLNLSDQDTQSFTRHQDLTKLHYQDSAISSIDASYNPSNLEHLFELAGVKSVQQPAIVNIDGEVIAYISDSDQFDIFAYNLTQREEIWRTDLAGYVESTPYLYDGVIYVGSYDNKLFAIDQSSGEILWSYSANDTISGGPILIHDGKVFFTDYGYGGTTTLYAVDLSSHNLSWSFPVSATTFMSYTIDPTSDVLYLTYQDMLIKLATTDGNEIWSTDLDRGYITKQPALSGDRLVIGADRGLVVVNSITGQTIYSNPDNFSVAESGIGATPVVKNGIIYYPTKSSSKVIARKLSDGTLVWSTDVTDVSGTFSTPVLSNNQYLYIAYDAGVKVFDISDGSKIWQSVESAWGENIIGLAHGYMLFTDPSGSGTLHVYQLGKENYSSTNGLTIRRTDQEVTSIKLNGVAIGNFNCDAQTLTIDETGDLEVTYGTLATGISKPDAMIINSLTSNSIQACHPSGTGISFTYPIALSGSERISTVLKDGLTLPTSAWSYSNGLITITDSFSSHKYQFITSGSDSSTTSNNTNIKVIQGVCPDVGSIGVPDLFEIRTTQTEATLFFTPSLDMVDEFIIIYGENQSNLEHGLVSQVPYIDGVVPVTIRDLLPGKKYYFQVASAKGCLVSPWSETLSARTLELGSEKKHEFSYKYSFNILMPLEKILSF